MNHMLLKLKINCDHKFKYNIFIYFLISKVHVSENSHVKEHCSVYALSDNTEIEFRQQCDHDHDESSEECEAIASTMKDIEELLSRALYPSDDHRDEPLYLFHTAQRAIHTWKCHQLRSVQQDKARLA